MLSLFAKPRCSFVFIFYYMIVAFVLRVLAERVDQFIHLLAYCF